MPLRPRTYLGPSACASLALALALCGLWGRSYFREDRCDFESRPDPTGRSNRIGVISLGGSLCVIKARSTRTESLVLGLVGFDERPVSLTAATPPFTWSTRPARPLAQHRSPLAHLVQFRRFREGNSYVLKTPGGTVTSHHRQTATAFPYWCVVLPAALPAAVWSAARLRGRRHRRAGFYVAAIRARAARPANSKGDEEVIVSLPPGTAG